MYPFPRRLTTSLHTTSHYRMVSRQKQSIFMQFRNRPKVYSTVYTISWGIPCQLGYFLPSMSQILFIHAYVAVPAKLSFDLKFFVCDAIGWSTTPRGPKSKVCSIQIKKSHSGNTSIETTTYANMNKIWNIEGKLLPICIMIYHKSVTSWNQDRTLPEGHHTSILTFTLRQVFKAVSCGNNVQRDEGTNGKDKQGCLYRNMKGRLTFDSSIWNIGFRYHIWNKRELTPRS